MHWSRRNSSNPYNLIEGIANMLNLINRDFVNQQFAEMLVFELSKYKKIDFVYTTEHVPSTGKAIHAMFINAIRYGSRFRVFNGANDAENLFFSPQVNLFYRALHDVHHAEAYAIGTGGTTKLEDELKLNCKMAYLAFSYTLANHSIDDALAVFFAVYHDTVGQVHYYRENQDFCVNQKANTIKLLNECEGLEALKLGRTSQARQVMLNYMTECKFSG